MLIRKRTANGALGGLVAVILLCGFASGDDELYAPMSLEDAKSRTLEWVATKAIKDKAVLEEIGKVWADVEDGLTARDLFGKVIATFQLADAETDKLVKACGLVGAPLVPPHASLTERESLDYYYTANLGLFYAHYLTQRAMYDEALNVFALIDVKKVVDPATFFFFKATCEHQLLMKKAGLATLGNLLKNTEGVPIRYSAVATLMQYDLEGLREKTLGVVARKMRDSQRRLDLARGGQRVQKVQTEIIAELDEIIEKIEQQQGGGGGGGEGSGKNRTNQPGSSPAKDSVVKGSTAPGNVDARNFKKQGGWGSLPPKEQARAKNMINRFFPAHYRQAVEQYFKKLATRRASSGR